MFSFKCSAASAAAALWLLTGWCDPACADDEVLSEVVVTATRTPMRIEDFASPAFVITREAIDQSAAGDVADLIAEHAGIEVTRLGGTGQTTSVFMRGANSDQVAVLVDGVSIGLGSIGGPNLQNILSESVERVEVVEGPRSYLYGTDAIGGVINVTTRASGPPGASVYASISRYGTYNYAASGSGDLNDTVGGGANLSVEKTDGFPSQSGAGIPDIDSAYSNVSANAQVHVALNDELTLRAKMWRAQGQTGYIDFSENFPFNIVGLTENYATGTYAAEADWAKSAAGDGRLMLSRAEDVLEQLQSSDFARTARNSADLQDTVKVGSANTLTAGTTISHEVVNSVSFGTPYDDGMATQLYFLQDELRLGDDVAVLGIGEHRFQIRSDLAGVNFDRSAGQLIWSGSVSHELAPGLRLNAEAGSAFHAPTATDLFGFGGNPALLPEFSHQVDVGLDWKPIAGQWLRIDAFNNNVDELIIYDNFTNQDQNIGRARIRGIEATYDARFGSWRTRLDGTVQDPRQLADSQDAEGPLLRRAHYFYSAMLAYEAHGLELAATFAVVGERSDYGFPTDLAMGGYALLNIVANYQLTAGWSVQAALNNALNRNYVEAVGYNTPKRSALLAMRYQWH
ncbi:MAG TPA: TonB-dependent receptor [Steroidobacteraceae bacterium]